MCVAYLFHIRPGWIRIEIETYALCGCLWNVRKNCEKMYLQMCTNFAIFIFEDGNLKKSLFDERVSWAGSAPPCLSRMRSTTPSTMLRTIFMSTREPMADTMAVAISRPWAQQRRLSKPSLNQEFHKTIHSSNKEDFWGWFSESSFSWNWTSGLDPRSRYAIVQALRPWPVV